MDSWRRRRAHRQNTKKRPLREDVSGACNRHSRSSKAWWKWCQVTPAAPAKNPTYEDYAEKGHVEAVQITYDPSIISYSQLLDVFWRQIDPTDPGGQFVDRGPQYRSAIFYHNEEQKRLAEKSKEELAKSGRFDKPIVTEIIKATTFYKAEDYHQDYYKKNPIRYKYYRFRSGRDQYLEKVWGQDKDPKGNESKATWNTKSRARKS